MSIVPVKSDNSHMDSFRFSVVSVPSAKDQSNLQSRVRVLSAQTADDQKVTPCSSDLCPSVHSAEY